MGSGLGESLRVRARELGLSDAEVARRVGLGQSRYAHYVSGVREPDLATLARICRALALSPNEALGFEQKPTQSAERQRLVERVEAAVEVMHLGTLRTAVDVLNVLVIRQEVESSGNDVSDDALNK